MQLEPGDSFKEAGPDCTNKEIHFVLFTSTFCKLLKQMLKAIFTARKRSLGKGNVFSSVCRSVHGGRGGSAWGDLPPGILPPGVLHPGALGTPPSELEKRAVCILLEFFLVLYYFEIVNSEIKPGPEAFIN